MYLCVRCINFASVYYFVLFDFENDLGVVFVLFSMIVNTSYTTGAISVTGTAHPSGASMTTPSSMWGSYSLIFNFICSVLEIIYVLLFCQSTVLSALCRCPALEYPFGFFMLSLISHSIRWIINNLTFYCKCVFKSDLQESRYKVLSYL